MLKKSS